MATLLSSDEFDTQVYGDESPDEGPPSGPKNSPTTVLSEVDDEADAPSTDDADSEAESPEDAEQDQQEGTKKATEDGAEVDYTSLQLGQDAALNEQAFNQAVDFAKEHKLPLETAKALIEERDAHARSVQEGWAAQVDQWAGDLRKDPDLGGKNLPQTVQRARAAINQLGRPGLLQRLNESGFGNNLDFIAFAAAAGERLLEPSELVRGGESVQKGGSDWEGFFDNSGEDPSRDDADTYDADLAF